MDANAPKQNELKLQPRPAARRVERHAKTNQRDILYRQRLFIDGMRCASCAQNIQRGLQLLHPEIQSAVNFATNRLDMASASSIDVDMITRQIADMGYIANKKVKQNFNHNLQTSNFDIKLYLSLTLAALFLLDMVWQGFWHINLFPFWTVLLFATIAQSYLGIDFYRSFWKNLKTGRFNMDSLVAIGTSAAFGLSLSAAPWKSIFSNETSFWLVPAGHNYFEASVFVLCFVHIGQCLESKIRKKLQTELTDLAHILGKEAKIEINGQVKIVPLADIEIGQIVVIDAGQRIPADGVIVFGDSDVDESAMTGEPMPVHRMNGDAVYAGTINLTRMIKIRATSVGENTRIGYIRDLVETAASQKPPIAKTVDVICAYFVPSVLILSALTFVLWAGYDSATNRDLSRAIFNAVAVLVIACPCALGLATPMVVIATIAKAARQRILIKDAAAIERLEQINCIVMDKTGTLTVGRPSVTDVIPFIKDADHVLRLASAAVGHSQHPISKAIAQKVSECRLAFLPAQSIDEIPGQGLTAEVIVSKSSSDPFSAPLSVPQRIYIGNRRLLNSALFDLSPWDGLTNELALDGKSLIFIGVEQIGTNAQKIRQVAGVIALHDALRPGMADFIQSLYRKNLAVLLLTGDNKAAAERIAQRIGIDDVQADIIPEEKSGRVLSLRQRGRKVLMLGDGINDAAAIANSDIGVAIAGGSDLAMNSAHIGLMNSNPAQLLTLFSIGAEFRRKIKQNLAWAFGFNIIGLPIAAFGFMHPGFAGFAMAMSSIMVVANAASMIWGSKFNRNGI